ncbi:metal-dependent hydrolase [Candidatus Bathyarchaeota archaeon]|nr:metal-dependent hydrolase [Candidatus Bathyarchaeota archaeon]
MFAIGHFGLGYLAGKVSSRYLKTEINLPLLLTASILPDVDLVLRFLEHRGSTHSLITETLIMLPFFLVYRKAAFPYFAALLSHPLVGDFLTGGVKLFWPFSNSWFAAMNIDMMNLTNVSMELILFITSLAIMLKMGDLQILLKPHNGSIGLIIPFAAVVLPILSSRAGTYVDFPALLIVPSLIYISIFSYSILIQLKKQQVQTLKTS